MFNTRSKAWLSNGVEVLVAREETAREFDFVIIGSGYGGAIAAEQLAGSSRQGKLQTVCVLERGKEFTPGSFPSSMSEVPTEFRFTTPKAKTARGLLDGLYDIRIGEDVNIVLANGLGGGSLINAGVMERPDDRIFDHGWPKGLRDFGASPVFDRVLEKLGGTVSGVPNTIEDHPEHLAKPLAKHESLKRLGGNNKFREAAITIAMEDRTNWANVNLKKCILCGDCASGCNIGAKDSLDTNLLVSAFEKGAELYTGATAVNLKRSRSGAGWEIEVVYTDKRLRRDQQEPVRVFAKNVILAAGSLGSTELLLKAEEKNADLLFSKELGGRFSTNGDALVTGYNQSVESNSVASDSVGLRSRHIGPTITGVIDNRDNAQESAFVVQEMAVPAPLECLFTELITTSSAMRTLYASPDEAMHDGEPQGMPDPLAVSATAMRNTSLYGVMGNDGALGKISWNNELSYMDEGTVQVNWKNLRDSKILENGITFIQGMVDTSEIGGEVIANPVWKALPDAAMFLVENQKGPPLTVHPLGGCAMADNAEDGVVDDLGRVFDPTKHPNEGAVYEGLYVLDGSIIPSAIGTNPALTIASVAQRAIEKLINDHWRLTITTFSPANQIDRTIFREPVDHQKNRQETEIQVVERLSGAARVKGDDGKYQDVVIELSLNSKNKGLRELAGFGNGGYLNNNFVEIDPDAINPITRDNLSKLRIFLKQDWDDFRAKKPVSKSSLAEARESDSSARNSRPKSAEEVLESIALFSAPISGRLNVFSQEKSSYAERLNRGRNAWLLNRGARDIWQSVFPKEYEIEARSEKYSGRSVGELWADAKALASRAGGVRRLEYDVTIGESAVSQNSKFKFLHGQKIQAVKRFTYNRRANPWRQLSQATITKFPNMKLRKRKATILDLDTRYLARIGVPLIKLVIQENQVRALSDLVSFVAYVARIVMHIHVWSFRKPDIPKEMPINRLAGRVRDLPEPDCKFHEVDKIPTNDVAGLKKRDPVCIRLAHYKHRKPKRNPLLIIHGYSVSSTSFAHKSVRKGLAWYFFKDKRDVWLVDLRTSAAFKSARYPWSFEDVAEKDIWVAVDKIYEHYSGTEKIDVIAYCMGAAMFGMGVLNSQKLFDKSKADLKSNFYIDRLNKVVFAQTTPALALTPDNALRALIVNYTKELLPKDYQFNPWEEYDRESDTSAVVHKGRPKLTITQQLLDRFLYTLPYPEEEFDITNPPLLLAKRVTYAQTRHRMDALYGRDFNLPKLRDITAKHIDDLFGPMSIETVTQVMHFAEKQTVTTKNGYNLYVSKNNLQKHWPFETFSFHGKTNGLVDFATGERTKAIFNEAGCSYETMLIDDVGYGHQDSIIGKRAYKDVFPHIKAFFDKKPTKHNAQTQQANSALNLMMLDPPYAGPILIDEYNDFPPISNEPTTQEANGTEKTLRLMVGTNESLGVSSKPLLIKVRQVNGKYVLANPKDSIDEAIALFFENTPSVMDYEGMWLISDFERQVFEPSCSHDGILVLLAYDQLKSIGNVVVNSPREVHGKTLPAIIEGLTIEMLKLYPDRQIMSSKGSSGSSLTIVQILEDQLRKMLDKLFLPSGVTVDEYQDGFVALPTSNSDSMSFVFGSCQYGHGLFDHSMAYDSYKLLGRKLDGEHFKDIPQPQFSLLVGDQVYTDPTVGVVDPKIDYDRYDLPYRRLFENRHVRSVTRRLPIYTMLDDHELIDNWQPTPGGVSNKGQDHLRKGLKSYFKYQRGVIFEDHNIPRWYTFEQRNVKIFMMDTRTEREARTASALNDCCTTIMDPNQYLEIKNWLSENNEQPKFLVSPSILLPRHRHKHGSSGGLGAIRSDSWDGYPISLHKLLAYIVDNEISNITFLSGDEHLSCNATITIVNTKTRTSAMARSFHCSGLYAPYPFANSSREDLISHETFKFNEHYECTVETTFKSHASSFSGFASITVDGKGEVAEPVFIR